MDFSFASSGKSWFRGHPVNIPPRGPKCPGKTLMIYLCAFVILGTVLVMQVSTAVGLM
jgi:hypothetical protein